MKNNNDTAAAAANATDETINIDDDANLATMMNSGSGSGHRRIRNIPEAAITTEAAVSSAASSVRKMLSSVGTLTVQKYILQLHQKDQRIRELEEENRKLRMLFKTKAEQLQQRNEQLHKNLSQHAELVLKLETDLANCRRKEIPTTHLRDEIPLKKVRRNVPSSTTSSVSKAPVPSSSSFMPQKQQQQSTTNSTDEICAKLQTFVEKNNQQPIGNSVGDHGLLEIDEYAAEQLVKMMAEEPSLLQAFLQIAGNAETTAEEEEEGGMYGGPINEDDINSDKLEDDPTNLLALLFDAAAASSVNVADQGQVEEEHYLPMKQQKMVSSGSRKEQELEYDEVAQKDQQSLEFEEVMQRVIGDAMNVTNAPVTPTITAAVVGQSGGPRGTRSATANAKSHASVNVNAGGGTKGGKQKALNSTTLNHETTLAMPKIAAKSLLTSVKSEPKNAASSAIAVPTMTPLSHAAHHHSSSSTAKPFTPEEQELVTELEARIDENIIQLGLRPLNTAELAVQCTRIMREYSIGQRLFARTVMCKVSQSQGSLSELLSKPRPWHKLTDKGRDAFRRIFGWISDNTAIDLLCQLSPRKVAVTENIIHPNPETLLEPLDGPEAAAMLVESTLGNCGNGKKGSIGNKQTHHPTISSATSSECTLKSIKIEPMAEQQISSIKIKMESPLSLNAMGGTSGRWRHDDIPKEKIINIFEAEKAKLMEKESSNMSSKMSGGCLTNTSDNDSRMGSVSPLRWTATTLGGEQLGNKSRPHKDASTLDDLLHIARSPSVHSAASSTFGSDQNMGGCDNITPYFSTQRGAAGRLEYFTISQSQIERYTQLDTEEIVGQVKEFLAKNAVSQRQFGESVLGLSQGSVSDLLARPKAWHLLTPKGREPFVRMHIFMERYMTEKKEEDLEAAERMNERGKIEEETRVHNTDGMVEELGIIHAGDSFQAADNNDESDEGQERSEIDDNLAAASAMEGNDTESDKFLQNILAKIQRQPSEELHTSEKKPTKSGQKTGAIPQAQLSQQQPPQMQSEQMEVDEIDTAYVARRVKECLSKSGISQRAFGEHILKMTSGCVSDLLTKPKAWVLLGWKQRQSYQKMLEFLNDSGAVERLRADEQHRCEMNSALNALKAIAAGAAAAAAGGTSPGADKPPSLKLQPSGLAGLTALVEQHSSPLVPTKAESTASTLEIVTSLANELGAQTPIGTLLKKANSPKPTARLTNGNHHQQLNASSTKRKTTSSSSEALSNTMVSMTAPAVPVLSVVGIDTTTNELGIGGPPPKKIPRFQRTMITEKQKEALRFVFAHEQRPNSRCIEQLAAKLGLTPRTVTNWFHNHRTRQKAKEIKQDGDDLIPANSTISSSPATLCSSSRTTSQQQVLTRRSLNVTDTKSAKLFRELAELLRRHSDANLDMDIIGSGSGLGSVGTASAESSPPSPPQMNGCYGEDDDNGLYIDEDADEDRESNIPFGEVKHNGSSDRGKSCGASSSASASSPPRGGGSQLDKVIARMHSRLAKTGRVQ